MAEGTSTESEEVRVVRVLREVARHVKVDGDVPTVEARNYFVNARGQLLETNFHEPDLQRIARVPDEAIDAAIAELRGCPKTISHAHRCVNDGGFAYIQAVDTDAAVLREYVLKGWLEHVAMHVLADAMSDAVVGDVANALVADDSQRVLAMPVMGIQLETPIHLPNGPVCRPVGAEDRSAWNRAPFERGERKDLASCACIVEVAYTTPWPPREDHIATGTFDTEACAKAIAQIEDALALMRIVTGLHLPVMIAENWVARLPWVHRRDWLAPNTRDFLRRKDDSPMWARVEQAEAPSADFTARLTRHWEVLRDPTCPGDLRTAVRLMLRDQDFVTLYKVLELTPKRFHKPENKVGSFKRTANDPFALSVLWARHARPQGAPQNSPMSIDEARRLIRAILEAWFATL